MTILGWFVLLASFVGLLVIVRTWLPGLRLPLPPFPDEWRAILERHVRFYRFLDPVRRKKFERDVLDVLNRGKIIGQEGYRPDNEVRLLVAAGFATFSHAMAKRVPDFKQNIVIVPGTKAEDFAPAPSKIAVEVFATPWLWRPMFVAAKAVLGKPQPGKNPVLHRLAHGLDFDLKRFAMDDLPAGLQASQQAAWQSVRDLELEKLREKASPLPNRALDGRGELFACAVEMFFEDPGPLNDKSPELYKLLAEYFKLDTARLYTGAKNGK